MPARKMKSPQTKPPRPPETGDDNLNGNASSDLPPVDTGPGTDSESSTLSSAEPPLHAIYQRLLLHARAANASVKHATAFDGKGQQSGRDLLTFLGLTTVPSVPVLAGDIVPTSTVRRWPVQFLWPFDTAHQRWDDDEDDALNGEGMETGEDDHIDDKEHSRPKKRRRRHVGERLVLPAPHMDEQGLVSDGTVSSSSDDGDMDVDDENGLDSNLPLVPGLSLDFSLPGTPRGSPSLHEKSSSCLRSLASSALLQPALLPDDSESSLDNYLDPASTTSLSDAPNRTHASLPLYNEVVRAARAMLQQEADDQQIMHHEAQFVTAAADSVADHAVDVLKRVLAEMAVMVDERGGPGRGGGGRRNRQRAHGRQAVVAAMARSGAVDQGTLERVSEAIQGMSTTAQPPTRVTKTRKRHLRQPLAIINAAAASVPVNPAPLDGDAALRVEQVRAEILRRTSLNRSRILRAQTTPTELAAYLGMPSVPRLHPSLSSLPLDELVNWVNVVFANLAQNAPPRTLKNQVDPLEYLPLMLRASVPHRPAGTVDYQQARVDGRPIGGAPIDLGDRDEGDDDSDGDDDDDIASGTSDSDLEDTQASDSNHESSSSNSDSGPSDVGRSSTCPLCAPPRRKRTRSARRANPCTKCAAALDAAARAEYAADRAAEAIYDRLQLDLHRRRGAATGEPSVDDDIGGRQVNSRYAIAKWELACNLARDPDTWLAAKVDAIIDHVRRCPRCGRRWSSTSASTECCS
ncbi:hypothetical protein BC828DRAFT_176165 [Blastocladiella britannica]|nr:hypothetical protein BC828DRAFT_176165 [Blastocladiella britannica]